MNHGWNAEERLQQRIHLEESKKILSYGKDY